MLRKQAVRWSALGLVCALAACGGGGDSGSGGGGGSTAPTGFAINEAGGMPEGYQQVWSDEFDTDGLPDATKWNYDTSANATGWYNHELQYYAAGRIENSHVDGGVLNIDARKESAVGLPDYWPASPQQYTSARMVTQGKASWTYGFVEVRAKVPCGKGAWPAIWLLADVPQLDWPLDGEIDMMEHINSDAEVHFSVHTDAHNHVDNTQATNTNRLPMCDGAFHTYQMTWTADSLKLGMDGRNYLQYRNEGTGKKQWPFGGPQYLLLNVAVGGDWPGSPDASSSFPMRMEVDYVRVYQKP